MDSVGDLEKTSQELWNDYHFLTKEMAKFLDKQDIDFFLELMEQRGTLETIIEATKDEGFRLSMPGRELLQSIQRTNQHVKCKLQYLLNDSRNQQQISRAYDNLEKSSVGKRMDWQT